SAADWVSSRGRCYLLGLLGARATRHGSVRGEGNRAIRRRVDKAWTIRRVLAWTAEDFAGRGIETARLDAELLVAHALGLGRVQLYMDLDRPLTDAEREAIRAVVVRRRKH